MSYPFQEPYPTEDCDEAHLQEMDRLSEPAFKLWAQHQMKSHRHWFYPFLSGIALAMAVAALLRSLLN